MNDKHAAIIARSIVDAAQIIATATIEGRYRCTIDSKKDVSELYDEALKQISRFNQSGGEDMGPG